MLEIERKFLVLPDDRRWENGVIRSFPIKQGYFKSNGEMSLRVRITDTTAYLTMKRGGGITRLEFEYEIPAADAESMLQEFCQNRMVEKTRYIVPAAEAGLCWEIDEYLGALSGHYTAEIELPSADYPFSRPEWLGRELSGEARFLNEALALSQEWPEER